MPTVQVFKKLLGAKVCTIEEESLINGRKILFTFDNDYQLKAILFPSSSMMIVPPQITISKEEYNDLIEIKAKYEGLQK